MTFAEHITTNVFLPRLTDRRILVVYHEHKRFEGTSEMNLRQCTETSINYRKA